MLVRTDRGAINEVHLPVEDTALIGILLECVQDLVPDPGQLPAAESRMDGAPRAKAFGEVAPGSTGGEDPQHAVDHEAVVARGTSGAWSLWWEHWLEPLPLVISECMSIHPPTLSAHHNHFAYRP